MDKARFNKALIRPVHRGGKVNDFLPRLTGIKYLKLINDSLGYQSLKLDERSPYKTPFSFLFGRYRYT